MVISNNKSEKYINYIQTNISPCLSWSVNALDHQILMKEYFSYCGYDISIFSNLSDEEIENYEKNSYKRRNERFEIKDMGNYLLVYLGPSSN